MAPETGQGLRFVHPLYDASMRPGQDGPGNGEAGGVATLGLTGLQ